MIRSNLYFSNPQIVLQEIPDQLTLALSISGCNLGCKGCHSSETWNNSYGSELTIKVLENLIEKNKHITCVLIYDGFHDVEKLVKIFKTIKSYNLKTALYTGLNSLEPVLVAQLDYFKLGNYVEELGGLDKEITNQKLYKVLQNKRYIYNFKIKDWILI